MTTEAVLRTESLTKHYGRVRAVDGLDLEVRRTVRERRPAPETASPTKETA